MRLLHTSDWHLGKNLNGHSLIEDQKSFLNQIQGQLHNARNEGKPYAALLVPGDIYDRSVPPEEATVLLSDFFSVIRDEFPELHLFIIAGNHDSASRLSFAAELFKRQNIHIAGTTKDFTEPYILTQNVNGNVESAAVYQLPYLYPRSIDNSTSPDEFLLHQQDLYSEACSRILKKHSENHAGVPSVICAHLFTLGSSPAGSERSNIGTAEQVGVEVFDGFTYGAFGHIHGFHVCDRAHRCFYSGAPLAYHVDDNPETFMLDVEINGTDVPLVTKIPFIPLHPLVKLEGRLNDFLSMEKKWSAYKNHYVHISLTDEVMVANAHELLRPVFPFLISVKPKDRIFSGGKNSIKERRRAVESKDIEVIFDQFILDVNGKDDIDEELLSAERKVLKELAAGMKWGENL